MRAVWQWQIPRLDAKAAPDAESSHKKNFDKSGGLHTLY